MASVVQPGAIFHPKLLVLAPLVLHEKGGVVFDFGDWKSTVASRKNDDGTISFITIDPSANGFEFVVAERGGKRALVIRDGRHEHVFTGN